MKLEEVAVGSLGTTESSDTKVPRASVSNRGKSGKSGTLRKWKVYGKTRSIVTTCVCSSRRHPAQILRDDWNGDPKYAQIEYKK